MNALGGRYVDYIDTFEDAGWDTIEEIALMTPDDFKSLGVKPGHIRRLEHYIQSIREAENGDVEKAKAEPEKYFHITPNSKDLHVTFYDESGAAVVTTTADKPVAISALPKGKLSIKVKVSLDGTSSNLLDVHECKITNTASGVSTQVVNTGLTQLNTHWANDGVPLAGASVTAQSDYCLFTGTTDSSGNFLLTAKPGSVKATAISGSTTMSSIIKLFNPTPISDPAEAVNAEPQVYALTTGAIGSHCATLIGPTARNLVLGDVSGSMGTRNRIKNLQDYMRLALDSIKTGEIFLATWDTSFYPCTSSYIPKSQYSTTARNYINALRAKGGNDMAQAIRHGLSLCSDAQIVTVLCDGDVAPFSSCEQWKQFSSMFSHVSFNFIALDRDSQWEMMAEMAHIGRGSFLAFNC